MSAEAGWEELRREIEALQTPWLVIAKPSYVHGWRVAMDRVLAIVDRLAAARGEPPEPGPAIDVERLAEAVLAARSTTARWKGNARASEPTKWDRLMAKRILSTLTEVKP